MVAIDASPNITIGSPLTLIVPNKDFTIEKIPRVEGGIDKESSIKAQEFYKTIIKDQVTILSSVKSAEATKIMENTFRDINIAFINEMAKSFDKAGIDIMEVIKGAETIWLDGPLTTAIKTGAILYLDEIAEARPDVIVAIHSLTDHRRELFIDKLGETVKAHKDFMLVASFNPGYQRGFKELKPSTRQRFVAISFDYPNPTSEAEILINETNIDQTIAKKLVAIATKIRNLTELGLTETVSTRLLVDAAKLIHTGLPKRLAVHVAIVEPLTDDIETIAALKDLCDLMI